MRPACVNPVVHLELNTGNLSRACSFYTRLFGWRAESIAVGPGSYLALALGNAITLAGGLKAPPVVAPGLDELVTAIRAVVSRPVDWAQTARLVAGELRRHLPSPQVLSGEQRIGDPTSYRSHVLHAEAEGTFSIVALVWHPGQVTQIHDHVTWCVFGVIHGVEQEELFTLDETRGCLVEAGTRTNKTGEVSGFAPPGDIHRVRNAGDQTAISIHVYGTDVSRIGSSVRRYCGHPIQPRESG